MADNVPEKAASIRSLTSAEMLMTDVERIQRSRQVVQRDWVLNQLFFRGKQYTFFNKRGDNFQALPTEEGEKPRYRVRLVDNHILPGVQNYISQLTKTKPVISATPNSGSNSDIKAAEMAEHLFGYWWHEFSLKDKSQEALKWGALCGNGYWLIQWDPQAGKPMTFVTDPDGQPITDDELRKFFDARMEQMGVDKRQFRKTVHMGDIKISVPHPENVLPDLSATSWDEVRYVYIKHAMSVDEVQERWGVTVSPDSSPGPTDPTEVTDPNTRKLTKDVYVGYFKPTPTMPKGRVVVFTDTPKKILADGPWDMPFNYLPLVPFPGIDVPGRLYDEAITTHARPIQMDINKTTSQIIEWKNLVTRPRMLAPVNSLRTRVTNEPGRIYQYNPVHGLKPEWEQVPSLPQDIFVHLQNMKDRMDRMFFIAAVSRGELPGARVDSGVLIDLLQETAVDQFAPIIQRYEETLARAGNIMMSLAKKHYAEPRLLKIRGEGGSIQAKEFMNSDIDGGFDLHAEAGSGLPRTRAGRQAEILQMMESGIIQPHQGMKHLPIADMQGVRKMMSASEEHALREHEYMLTGEPLNPAALQEAMQVIEAGINPATNLPWSSTAEIQAFLTEAELQPLPFENTPQHIETHALWMMSPEFRNLPLEVQMRMQYHFSLSQQKAAGEAQSPETPRVTLQYKGTLSPTAAAKITQKAGVPDITREDLQEAPLETWVTDSMDKPDADEAGNDPYTAEERLLQMRQSELDAQLKQAQILHTMMLAKKKDARDEKESKARVAKLRSRPASR